MEIKQVDHLNEISTWKQAYLAALTGPLDQYWETAVIGLAPHYVITVDAQPVGYFAAKGDCLLQFYVTDAFLPAAAQLFTQLCAAAGLTQAVVSTVEPGFLSLCLDRQTAVSVNSYLFQDHRPVHLRLPAYPQAEWRPAAWADEGRLTQFYIENDESEDSEAIEVGFGGQENFVRSLIKNGQVFLLITGAEVLGVGECRISRSQPPFADLGMITHYRYRCRGIGAFILAQLKKYCYSQDVKPICSCAATNMASRKTIEKAGFVTQQRILDIQF